MFDFDDFVHSSLIFVRVSIVAILLLGVGTGVWGLPVDYFHLSIGAPFGGIAILLAAIGGLGARWLYLWLHEHNPGRVWHDVERGIAIAAFVGHLVFAGLCLAAAALVPESLVIEPAWLFLDGWILLGLVWSIVAYAQMRFRFKHAAR